MKTKAIFAGAVIMLACLSFSGGASAGEGKAPERLLAATEGLQMPSSESDSVWKLVSYPGVEGLPEAERFGELSGCPQGGTTRLDADETFRRLSKVEPWMDAGQVRSARGFRKLEGLFNREFGGRIAIYRCETGGPEVNVYFVGAEDDRLVGLMTVSIET